MRKPFKVILDADDVLFACNDEAIRLLNEETGHNFALSDITGWGILGNDLDKRLRHFNDPSFVTGLPLYPGAKDFVRKLSKRAEIIIATHVPPECAGARMDAIIRHFPEIKVSNILIGGRKDLLTADMMLDDAPQNLMAANVEHPVLFRKPWNYGKTGLLSVSSYSEFLTLVDMVKNSQAIDPSDDFDAIVLVGPTGSGKKRFAEDLSKKYPVVRRAMSYSTKVGEHYHTVSQKEFETMRGDFFETSSYMGHLFGTKAEDIQGIIDSGRTPVLIMDVNGMIAMKSRFRALAIFVKSDKESCIRDILTRNLPLDEAVQRISSLEAEFRNEDFCDMTASCATDVHLDNLENR